jgi:predicted TIM-barrel fold metal-dependent hydrolase
VRRWAALAPIALALLVHVEVAEAQARRLPVIDMHLHASRVPSFAPIAICPGDQLSTFPAADPRDPAMMVPPADCRRPVMSPRTAEALRDETIAELRRYNVRRGVLAGTAALVQDWMAAAPGLFVPAALPGDYSVGSLDTLRQRHASGTAAVFAEVGAQYDGLPADDPKLAAFWSLAERLDVPVGIHLGEGMPGQSPGAAGDRYRVKLTSPFQLEQVLIAHPRLRVYVMHAASPLTDEMIAMLFEYPSLYVDVGANVWNMPRAQFYDQLKRMVDAGFSNRIMFGSDQTLWPQGIGLGIRSIEQAPFLTRVQKRDILYNNAARFLRLTKEQIAQDHAP